MPKKFKGFGKITIRTDTDKLVVAILNYQNEPYYKGIAHLNNKKELEQLKEDLRHKGVNV